MTARQQALVTINTNPQSASPLAGGGNFQIARVGTPWTGGLWGVGGAGGYGYTVISKPAWVTATFTTILGVGYLALTGTPGASGAIVVDVTDSASTLQRVSFYITVTSAITGVGGVVSVQPAYTGQPYSIDLKTFLTGATVPLTSSVVSTGTLPTGMSIHSTTGIIDATNVTGTTQNVVVTITDGASKVAVIPLRITVKPSLSVSTYAPDGILGQAYKGKVTVSGGSGKYSIIERPLNPLTAGLVVDPTTGDITGFPTALTPTTGAPTTRFQITDLVTGEQIITPALGSGSKNISIGSVLAPAPQGRFVTTAADGSQTTVDYLETFFGGGSDGDITIDGSTSYPAFAVLVSGVNLASRDIYANNVTITSSGHINLFGRRLFVAGTLDITNASANAIATSATVSGPGRLGVAGGTRGSGTNTNGTAGSPPATAPLYIAGGTYAFGGAGGHGAGANVGGSGGIPASFPTTIRPVVFSDLMIGMDVATGLAISYAGCGGGGGGGGGGSGAAPGGNGSDGGYGGDYVCIFARTIARGSSTAAGAINVSGGGSANGSSIAVLGRAAGGAGGAGSGGIARIYYGNLTGTTATNAIKANGGDAGDGGTALGAGASGDGGDGGSPGVIVIGDLLQGITTINFGSSPTAHAGTTGGTGGICQASL